MWRNRSVLPTALPNHAITTSQIASQQTVGNALWLLFCVHKENLPTLHHLDLQTTNTDQFLLQELKRHYLEIRRGMRTTRRFFWRLEKIQFIQVRLLGLQLSIIFMLIDISVRATSKTLRGWYRDRHPSPFKQRRLRICCGTMQPTSRVSLAQACIGVS